MVRNVTTITVNGIKLAIFGPIINFLCFEAFGRRLYLTGISVSFQNFRVMSGNSINSGNSVIPLKCLLNLRVIPGLRKYNIFPLDFRHPEFWNSRIPRKTE